MTAIFDGRYGENPSLV